jgi:hypothetical protein
LKRQMTVLLAIFVVSALVAASCSKAPHLRPGYVPPEDIVIQYHDAIRWGDYDAAKLLVAPKAQKAYADFMSKNEGKLNIVEYRISAVDVKDDGYTAVIKIKRNFFLYPSVTSQEIEMVQNWELIGGRWLLSGPPF